MKKSLFAVTLTALFLSACGGATVESEPACKEYAAMLQKQIDSAPDAAAKEALNGQLKVWKESMAKIPADQLKSACQAQLEGEKANAADTAAEAASNEGQ